MSRADDDFGKRLRWLKIVYDRNADEFMGTIIGIENFSRELDNICEYEFFNFISSHTFTLNGYYFPTAHNKKFSFRFFFIHEIRCASNIRCKHTTHVRLDSSWEIWCFTNAGCNRSEKEIYLAAVLKLQLN